MITAAADGSSLSNPGPAGWAWFVDEDRWAAGGWARGTNNMGELMAVLDLLRQTRGVDELRVLCDSQYAINVCTKWRLGWKRKGWRKADGQPVLNVDLVKELDRELTGREVRFEWVKGHAGHPLNERADDLARAAAMAFQVGRPAAPGPGFLAGSAPAVSLAVAPTGRVPEPDLFSDEPVPAGTSVTGPAASGSGSSASAMRAGTTSGSGGHGTAGSATRARQDPVEGRTGGRESGLVIGRGSGQGTAVHGAGAEVPSAGRPTLWPAPDEDAEAVVTALERELLSDEVLLDRERLGELLHPDYVAHEPGGAIRTRGSVLARAAALQGASELTVLGADRLAVDVLMLRYRLRRAGEDTLCASVWVYDGSTWRRRFHQATPAGA